MSELTPLADEMLTIWHDLNHHNKEQVVGFMRYAFGVQRRAIPSTGMNVELLEDKFGVPPEKHDTIPCPPPDPCDEDEPSIGDEDEAVECGRLLVEDRCDLLLGHAGAHGRRP